MGRRHTTKEFIAKAKKRNTGELDYSKVMYTARANKVIVTCSTHGDFLQTPNSILRGHGCHRCYSDSRLYTTEIFIKKAVKVHGDKYDYSTTVYTNSRGKVNIICKTHGVFNLKANSHLYGNGCKECRSVNMTRTLKKFLHLARIKHGEKYSYDKTVYTMGYKKVIITCPIHGDFKQQTNSHCNGAGCPVCKESKGEKKIAAYLDKNNIKYLREHKFKQSRYRYDFYLPELNILIEYDGVQHFKPVAFFGGESAHTYMVHNDRMKNKLARYLGMYLIRIKYTKYKELNSYLKRRVGLVLKYKIRQLKKVEVSYLSVNKKEKKK